MELGTVRAVDIQQEMRDAYLDYAMSVIVARALPDAHDGLKPVQRRILYAMHDIGLRPDGPYQKSARIVVIEQGQALCFRGETVRPMGCAAAGVNAIKLDPGDYVADASAIERWSEVAEGPEAELLTVTIRGYGKRTPLSEFLVKGRYGKGVRCLGGERCGHLRGRPRDRLVDV